MFSMITSLIGTVVLLIVLMAIFIYGFFKRWPLHDEGPGVLEKRGLKIAHGGVKNSNTRLNTLGAVQLAYQTDGIDGVEIDAQMTADGVIITEHDPELRINETGETIPFSRMTWLEVQKRQPDAARLEDIILYCQEKNFYLNIEIKPWFKRLETAKQVARLTKQHRCHKKCWISAFHPEILYQVKKTDPDIRTGYLTGNSELFKITNFPWRHHFHAYQMTLLLFRVIMIPLIKPTYLHLNTEELSHELLDFYVKNSNQKILIWTVNHKKTIDNYINQNISVITDVEAL